MPIGCAKAQFRNRFVSSAEVRRRLASSFRLTPLDPDARQSSRNFFAVGRQGVSGTIGLISSESQPFCAECTRLRLTSTGQLIACLAHDESMATRAFLQTDTPQAVRALQALALRQVDGKCSRTVFDTARAMVSVGG
jgi:cyclic pyranopterin phosphate synthase